ncbi:MAG TPA: Ig-like domain-containing protein [Candidatus Dormibacteraeota bacterium]|nr:Ig-like domain-containing protein [Candidatus Dormibacteraeota bacterium]
MKKRFNLLARLSAALTLIAMLLAPTVASAFTPTINEYAIPAGSGSQPFHITTGPDGNLWFTEQTGDNIGKITTSGVVTEYSVPTFGAQPGSITAGPDGNLWFTEFSGDHIGKITTSGVVTEYPMAPSGIEFGGITAGPDGNLWFTMINSNQVGKITTSGTVTKYTIPGGGGEQYITAGPDGNLWFTEQNANKIGKITTSGTVTEYDAPGTNPEPQDIVAGPDGNLWYTEFNGNNITKVTTSGTFTQYAVPTANAVPWGITVGPDNMLWFAEQGTNKIGQMNTSGSVTEYSVPTANSFPTGVVAGPDNNIWFTEVNKGNIGQLILPSKPPLPATKTATVVSGKSTVIDVTSGVSGNPDPNTVTIVSGPSHGTAVDPPGTITYTPNAGFTGSDSLVYQVCSIDDGGICSQGVLELSVIAATTATAAAPATGFGGYSNNPMQLLLSCSVLAGGLFVASIASRKYSKS